jgi:DNA mismatch repair ATPase MutS
LIRKNILILSKTFKKIFQTIKDFFSGAADTLKCRTAVHGRRFLAKHIFQFKESCENLPDKQNSFASSKFSRLVTLGKAY